MIDTGGILREADAATLAGTAEQNLFALFRAMARLPGGVCERAQGLSRHLSFPGNPMFKGIWAADLPGDGADAAIDATLDWFRAQGAPFLFWWTGPASRPRDLAARLEARGLRSMERQAAEFAPGIVTQAAGAPVMVLDLAGVDFAAPHLHPPGLDIRQVQDAAGLADFARVFVATYGVPDWAGQAWVDATLGFSGNACPWQVFVGYADDRPVATSIVFAGGGTVSPYGVATLPDCRRRGFGAAITLAPLRAARAVGYRYASLFATEAGRPVYARLGFAETGGWIDRHLWRNPDMA